MTSRVGKARIPSNAGKRIIFSEDQWALMEKAYGYQLPEPVRAFILLATEALRLVGSAELSAPALKKMIAKTRNLRDAARSLLEETDRPVKEDAAWKSFEAMTEETATVVKEFPNDHVQFLLVVNSVFEGCNLMLRDWASDRGLREGKMWDAWVQGISERMQYHGFPHAARKDVDKRDSSQVNSQFVLLINELQKHIPKKLCHHTQSIDALAQAIYRARKSNWWPELVPLNEEEAASLVESREEQTERYRRFRQKLAMDPNWVERRPGSFVRAEFAGLEEQGEEGQDEQRELKPRDG